MTQMDKEYIEKEYEQAIKGLLFSHVLTSFEAEEGFFFILQSRNFSLQ